MQIFVRLYPLIILCSVLGFHKGFLQFLFGGFVLMDFVTFLKHLTLDNELGCGFLLIGSIKQVSENFTLFLFFAFVLKFLNSDWLPRVLIRFLYELRGKSMELKTGICSKNVLRRKYRLINFLKEDSDVPLTDKMGEMREKSNLYTNSDEKIDCDDGKDCIEVDDEFDVSALRNLIKVERKRANEALTELEKERMASATAAEEAMAMILRLQNEKSLIEMESSQYRRLAEEKQIHDQEVIQSLQWLVWRHESERSLLEDQLKSCKRKLKRVRDSDECEEVEESMSSFNGNILDALENVFYSSRDANLSPE